LAKLVLQEKLAEDVCEMLFGKLGNTYAVPRKDKFRTAVPTSCLAISVLHLPNNIHKRAWIFTGLNKVLTIKLFV
jgi:hypothetical protein